MAPVDPAGFGDRLSLVTEGPARSMRLVDCGLRAGAAADFVVMDAKDADQAFADIAAPLWDMKRGRISFERPAAILNRP